MQSEYNDDIPAVLVTGDTAPDRLRDAQESGLILLHKPVANIKLRATVGNLMRAPRFRKVGRRRPQKDRGEVL